MVQLWSISVCMRAQDGSKREENRERIQKKNPKWLVAVDKLWGNRAAEVKWNGKWDFMWKKN